MPKLFKKVKMLEIFPNIMKNYVFSFDEKIGFSKELLGGKGANLAEMTSLGIPVPPGFTISTEACLEFLNKNKHFPEGLWDQVLGKIKKLEAQTGKEFGSKTNPLLVSVRSGAAVSMPGMMDTILNLGLNDKTVKGLAEKTGNETFAYDSYRRFIQMFGNVVMGIDHHHFEGIINDIKSIAKKKEDTELQADDWKEVVNRYQKLIELERGTAFPQDPLKQLERSIQAVFESWLIPRAITYRKIHKISDDLGTAVNVQTMVFGNKGDTSGTGVAFTRNPSTGTKKLYGEFLINAQGEDVVAGIRTPQDISHLEKVFPSLFKQLSDTAEKLENHFKDMQDLEFTIEEEKLYLLQTRSGKRAAQAALKIAVDMVEEGSINKKQALLRIDPESLNQLLHPRIADNAQKHIIAKGLPASPGAAVGQAVFSSDDAHEWTEKGKSVILIRHETSPEDIHGMHAAKGILTACGGMTSHAAVVARGMGTCCVAGATSVVVNEKAKKFTIGDIVVHEGDFITLDGSLGEVILGKCDTVPPDLSEDFKTVLSWADEQGSMYVRTNADTPKDAAKAREFGAKGIGLCRTEHMFFSEERISVMREMILSQNVTQREKALAKLLPYQRMDFKKIFEVMDGYPVTVRLLDPPLHEFLPHKNKDIELMAKELDMTFEEVKDLVVNLGEVNPMLGHRGCRLMITYPEIAKMQTRAITEAACEVQREGGIISPEIMVPLVGMVSELKFLKGVIQEVIQEVFTEQKMTVNIKIGTMIEVPRACLVADEIAEVAEFFSFGTNDLTQMTFGVSRDDTAKFLPKYVEQGYLQNDPFQVLDIKGVGRLIAIAVERGRNANPDIKIGICGEHGGEPSSINYCFHHDFQYVSCSPYRVPIARMAAAQSYLRKVGN